jgi:hypothetical protein
MMSSSFVGMIVTFVAGLASGVVLVRYAISVTAREFGQVLMAREALDD